MKKFTLFVFSILVLIACSDDPEQEVSDCLIELVSSNVDAENITVAVEVASDVSVNNYTWTFDDGSAVVTNNGLLEYTFNEPGEYNVTLNVEAGEQSCTENFNFTIEEDTTGNEQDSCDLAFEALVIDQDRVELLVTGGTPIYTYVMGDGTFETSENPWMEYFYEENGTYEVSVTSEECAVDTTIIIDGISNTEECGVEFNALDNNSIDGNVVGLSAFTIPENAEGTFVWDWADGNMSTTTIPEAEHVYSESGNYQVVVSFTGVNGCEDSDWINIVIEESVNIECNVELAHVESNGLTAYFSATAVGTGEPINYWWNWGNNNSNLEQTSESTHSFTFPEPGTYVVSVGVDFSDECEDVDYIEVTVD